MKVIALTLAVLCGVVLAQEPEQHKLKKPCDSSPCEHGTCKNGLLTYYCLCDRGYYGRNCDKKVPRPCDSEPCLNGGVCKNRHFLRYSCGCLPGYEGKNCETTPCDANPCLNGGTCNNGGAPNGGYSCACTDEYEGDKCQDEVPPLTHNCEDRNPCTPENASKGNYYFANDDKTKFVQCSNWGQCFVMPCGVGTEWDQELLTCAWP